MALFNLQFFVWLTLCKGLLATFALVLLLLQYILTVHVYSVYVCTMSVQYTKIQKRVVINRHSRHSTRIVGEVSNRKPVAQCNKALFFSFQNKSAVPLLGLLCLYHAYYACLVLLHKKCFGGLDVTEM